MTRNLGPETTKANSHRRPAFRALLHFTWSIPQCYLQSSSEAWNRNKSNWRCRYSRLLRWFRTQTSSSNTILKSRPQDYWCWVKRGTRGHWEEKTNMLVRERICKLDSSLMWDYLKRYCTRYPDASLFATAFMECGGKAPNIKSWWGCAGLSPEFCTKLRVTTIPYAKLGVKLVIVGI